MKTNVTPQFTRPGFWALFAPALCLAAFIQTTTLLKADEPIRKMEPTGKSGGQPEANKQERIISLVLLLREPRKLSEHTLATAVSKALGIKHSHDEGADTFVVAKAPYYMIKLDTGRFVVNTIEGPYFKDTDKLAAEIKDPRLSKAVHEHAAWLSIDWAEKQEPKDVKRVYQQIGKIAAALAGPDTLAIYNPDTDQFQFNDEALAQSLQGEDPLKNFASASGASDVASIRDDDPALVVARAEAKKQWPEFVKAFRAKDGKNFAVKGPITEGDADEYMWLTVTDIDDKEVHGTLANDPVDLKGFKRGQDLHIALEDVDDWIYTATDKRPRGRFTLKTLIDTVKHTLRE